jgi:pimeloyl-ACP methyl ester carboxylesterase
MSAFVLVHGAWHGAWCWYKVVPLLRRQGHTVVAFDLPAHGVDKRPVSEGTLPNYAARVCAALDECREPAVLVGHSMGGAVISQAAELRSQKVSKLVFVAAFLMPAGITFAEVAQKDTASIGSKYISFTADQSAAFVDRSAVRELFYGDCGDEDVALAQSLLVPISTSIYAASLRTTSGNFGRIPRVYIECTLDKAISIGAQRAMHLALPCERVVTLESSHSPFLSMPERLADALLNVGG